MPGPTSCQSTSLSAFFKLGSSSSLLIITCTTWSIYPTRLPSFVTFVVTTKPTDILLSRLTVLPLVSENVFSPDPATRVTQCLLIIGDEETSHRTHCVQIVFMIFWLPSCFSLSMWDLHENIENIHLTQCWIWQHGKNYLRLGKPVDTKLDVFWTKSKRGVGGHRALWGG